MTEITCSRTECLNNRQFHCTAAKIQITGKCRDYIGSLDGMRQETAFSIERRHGARVDRHRRPLK